MRIAGVQMDVAFGDRERNLAAIEARLRETAGHGAQLTVFPECVLDGYCFENLAEARMHAEPVPGPATDRLTATCRELSVFAVVGMLEAAGEPLFNAAVLVGPAGVAGLYRKVHLPYLGVDRFTTPGDRGFTVYPAGEASIGMSVCYDAAFPEAARVLALQGADLIALPTNWPPGAQCTAEYLINARALENNVYFMAVNRVGAERGFEFIGQSKICDPRGRLLAEARHTDEAILYADIDLAFARRKHIVCVPGAYEIDRFADRRPETYGRIASQG